MLATTVRLGRTAIPAEMRMPLRFRGGSFRVNCRICAAGIQASVDFRFFIAYAVWHGQTAGERGTADCCLYRGCHSASE